MSDLFLILFLFSIPLFLLSLVIPEKMLPLFKGKLEKKGMRWVLGLLIPVSFVLFGMTVEPSSVQNNVPATSVQTVNSTATKELQQTTTEPAQQDQPTANIQQPAQATAQENVSAPAQSAPPAKVTQPVPSTSTSSAPTYKAPTYTAPTTCGDGYYKNSDGICVHSPTKDPSVNTSGATAQCRDGSLSFSLHRQGTCSGHGGVSVWF